jgi:hypothetical protein
MVYESQAGTQFAVSADGNTWKRGGLLAEKSSDFDKFGHVTPFLLLSKNKKPTLYFGAAREKTWDVNGIAMVKLSDVMMKKFKTR